MLKSKIELFRTMTRKRFPSLRRVAVTARERAWKAHVKRWKLDRINTGSINYMREQNVFLAGYDAGALDTQAAEQVDR